MKDYYSRFGLGGLHGKHVVATGKGKTGNIQAFAIGHRKTKKNLCRDGRSQDLPATDILTRRTVFSKTAFGIARSAFRMYSVMAIFKSATLLGIVRIHWDFRQVNREFWSPCIYIYHVMLLYLSSYAFRALWLSIRLSVYPSFRLSIFL
jgi:hypothetical protein